MIDPLVGPAYPNMLRMTLRVPSSIAARTITGTTVPAVATKNVQKRTAAL